jgi:hypothetical protein
MFDNEGKDDVKDAIGGFAAHGCGFVIVLSLCDCFLVGWLFVTTVGKSLIVARG